MYTQPKPYNYELIHVQYNRNRLHKSDVMIPHCTPFPINKRNTKQKRCKTKEMRKQMQKTNDREHFKMKMNSQQVEN